jgi:hypothetical protein
MDPSRLLHPLDDDPESTSPTAPGGAAWFAGGLYDQRYRTRGFAPCATCPARNQAEEELMAYHLALRRPAAPERVRLLLIAESPPWSKPGGRVRHFYNPGAPHPDSLFRATATALLDDDRTFWLPEDKARALGRLAAGGFLLLDSAKCPVNHLTAPARRAALHACAQHVLRGELERVPFAPEGVICMVVRSTVIAVAAPVLDSLGLGHRLVARDGLPFPGRWPNHRARFIETLREIGARVFLR